MLDSNRVEIKYKKKETEKRIQRGMVLVRWRERLIQPAAHLCSLKNSHLHFSDWKTGGLILVYHRISDDPKDASDPFSVRSCVFKSHVSWLSRHYALLTATELVDRLKNHDDVKGTAVITFDDGHESLFTHAWPILRAYSAKATFFIQAGTLGHPLQLSKTQIIKMAEHGIEIGSHSVSHADLRHVPESEMISELSLSRGILSEVAGMPIVGLAYPFGRFDDRVVDCVRRAGYSYACACLQDRTNHPDDHFHRLARTEINRSDNEKRFHKKINGYYACAYNILYRAASAFSRR